VRFLAAFLANCELTYSNRLFSTTSHRLESSSKTYGHIYSVIGSYFLIYRVAEEQKPKIEQSDEVVLPVGGSISSAGPSNNQAGTPIFIVVSFSSQRKTLMKSNIE
jgi:hypothetical protein